MRPAFNKGEENAMSNLLYFIDSVESIHAIFDDWLNSEAKAIWACIDNTCDNGQAEPNSDWIEIDPEDTGEEYVEFFSPFEND